VRAMASVLRSRTSSISSHMVCSVSAGPRLDGAGSSVEGNAGTILSSVLRQNASPSRMRRETMARLMAAAP
jgi:hypothetical protein